MEKKSISCYGKQLKICIVLQLTSGVFFLNSRLCSISFFLDCSLSSCRLANTVAVASSSRYHEKERQSIGLTAKQKAIKRKYFISPSLKSLLLLNVSLPIPPQKLQLAFVKFLFCCFEGRKFRCWEWEITSAVSISL